MSVMSSEIDHVARTCVVVECNGMGIMLMSDLAVSWAGGRHLYGTTGWWGYATVTSGCGYLPVWAKRSPGEA